VSLVLPNVNETDRILEAVAAHRDEALLLVLGVDGVLVDYQDDFDAVTLPRRLRQQLQALAREPNVTVAFISGRRVRDLRSRCAVADHAFYIGLHGLEVVGPDFVATDHGAFERFRDQIRRIAEAVEPWLASVEGVRIENKETAIAVHTRTAASADAVWARLHLLNAAAPLVNRAELRPMRGDHVLELLPNVRTSRATAIRAVRECVERRTGKRVFSLVVCEETPDDDAGAAIEGRGLSVGVGRRRTDPEVRLASPAEVHHLLDRVAAFARSGVR
jgi:trehalose 6-phosphate phosphatase